MHYVKIISSEPLIYNKFMNSNDEITCDELQEKLQNKDKEDFILIDVREQEEYEAGNIKGSTLIPLNDLDDEIEDLDSSKEYIIHCRSGKRSKKALDFMRKMGFRNTKHLKGGINEWALQIDNSIEVA